MEIETAITRLSALAQETRLAIFRLLVVEGAFGLRAGDLADRLKVAAPTLSFHLNQLESAGLLHSRREGRQIFYAVDIPNMRALLDFMTQDCCQGHPELCLAPAAEEACAVPRTCSPSTKRSET